VAWKFLYFTRCEISIFILEFLHHLFKSNHLLSSLIIVFFLKKENNFVVTYSLLILVRCMCNLLSKKFLLIAKNKTTKIDMQHLMKSRYGVISCWFLLLHLFFHIKEPLSENKYWNNVKLFYNTTLYNLHLLINWS
jgi:hypothetical protein